ncbi:hypothetical protein R1sor_017324 [Riccia sorocarpa]|uniref:Reverse transcriptase domain-containing protein n=1 Tax=Riccia sorocarpa TaxID=122646 RepID=A0ABD3I6G6_9MARC
MKISLITYNVRGLTRRASRTRLKLALRDLQPSLDVLAIQEHKIREHKLEFYLKNVWSQATIVARAAADGIHTLHNPQVSAGKGGVALALSARLVGLMTQEGSIENRVVWVHLDGLKCGPIGIMAVYAPNTTAERTQLWKEITRKVDNTRAWVVLGDFNMITEPRDQAGGIYTAIPETEREAWEEMTTELRLIDNFTRKVEENWFSWDNMHRQRRTGSESGSDVTDSTSGSTQAGSDRILKRLDRIYTSEEISEFQDKYAILTSSSLSDHAPVGMHLLDGEQIRRQRARFCMNVSLLKDIDSKKTELMLQGKKITKEKKAKWEEMKGRMRQFSQLLQIAPENLEAQQKMQEARDEMGRMEEERARWVQLKLGTKWLVNGDIPTRVFFGMFKTRQKLLEVDSLLDEEGQETKEQGEMERIAEAHFGRLLAEDKMDEERWPEIQSILQTIKTKVSSEDKEKLDGPLTEEELREAAFKMKKGKSPGPDCAPVEFFTEILVPVLQKIINWNQSAFLLGRNIHTSVLTCNEALHQGKETGKDYILLQLDFRKAFDSVNWCFLRNMLQAFNFGTRFQNYIGAILATAASTILVNGKCSKPVKISRSVRQGCPLSPLLFILATEALTAAMEQEVLAGSIHRIYLQKANVHYSIGLYADDSHVIIKATREVALNTKKLLESYAGAT